MSYSVLAAKKAFFLRRLLSDIGLFLVSHQNAGKVRPVKSIPHSQSGVNAQQNNINN